MKVKTHLKAGQSSPCYPGYAPEMGGDGRPRECSMSEGCCKAVSGPDGTVHHVCCKPI